jgi:hypothetical protein
MSKIFINSELDRQPNNSRESFISFLSRAIPTHGYALRIGVSRMVIPNTAYTFHPNDSYLWYVTDLGGTDTLKSVTISTERLFENAQDLADHLQNLFTSNGDSITVGVNQDSLKLEFTNSTGSPIRFISDFIYEVEFSGSPLYNHANKKLGINSDLRNTSIPDGSVFTPAGLTRLSSTFAYHLISTTLVDPSQTSTPSPNKNPHVLASVLNNKGFGDLLTVFYSRDEIFYHKMSDDLSSIDIQVVDDEYRPVSLNGANIYVELSYSIIKE